MDGLVADSKDGLAGYEEGGFASVAFIHHQDHVEEPVENPSQGLDNKHISLNSDIATSPPWTRIIHYCIEQEVLEVPLSGLHVLVNRVVAGHRKPSQERSSAW